MGCIYMRTSPSGKSYIGQTQFTEERRWKEHCNVAYNENCIAYNYPLSRAIRKYGPDSFKLSILEDDLDNEDVLNDREIYWIDYYNTFKNGLNATRGGYGNKRADRKNILKLWDDGYCVRDIAILLDVYPSTILKHLNMSSKECQKRGPVIARDRHSTKTFGNYKIGRPTPVSCYDPNTGEYINSYPSANNAAKCLGLSSHSSILNAIRGKIKTAGGYLWKEGFDTSKIPIKPKQNKKTMDIKHIVCVETNKIYSSALCAEHFTGASCRSILHVCKGFAKTAGGFHWRYVTEEDMSNLEVLENEKHYAQPPNSQPVICLETGEVYASATKAGNAMNVSYSCILKCCRGTQNTCRGFHWTYAESKEGDSE